LTACCAIVQVCFSTLLCSIAINYGMAWPYALWLRLPSN